jgi:GT2 family glycosyltransferase
VYIAPQERASPKPQVIPCGPDDTSGRRSRGGESSGMSAADVSDMSQPPLSARRGSLVPATPQLSICILVLNDTALALNCLDSLRRPGILPPRTELIVVANGTPHEKLDALTAHDDVALVVNDVNLGFAGGSNQAASVARAPLLIFLNDDSTVEDGCIDALLRAAATDPAIGAVGARIVSPDGTLEEAGSVLWRDGWATHVGAGLPPDSDAFREPRDVDYASANGLLVTRSAWDTVGGFDERFYPAYFEDVDLCLALAEHGFRVRYEPRAKIVHQGSRSSTDVYRRFLLARNQRKLVEKWGQTLERFDPRPQKFTGPKFEAAVRKAVRRAASPHRSIGSNASKESGVARDAMGPPLSTDPVGAAEAARAEYLYFLEQRVTWLETYLDRLWGVRSRRWIGPYLARWRQ